MTTDYTLSAVSDTRPQAMTMTAIALYAPPPPPPSPMAAVTVAYLTAEVLYLQQQDRTDRLDAADAYRARGERLPSGHTVAGIVRKAAGMLRHCPPSALPVRPSLPRRPSGVTMGGQR